MDELGVDAAIIFSDILVIPEAMGLTYEMVEKKGPWFPKTIESLSDVEKLGVGENVLGELQYVFDALEVTKKELNGRVPLIGFAGAPWTIFSYMLEGSGSKTFSKARKFLYQNPKAAHLLLDKITQTTIAYLKQKVHSGANMIQVFDSWAGILPPHQYSEFAIPYIKKIVDAIEGVPVIVFAKGAWFAMEEISKLDCQVLGVDWNTKVGDLRDKLNVQQVLQGNLDPCMLYSSQENIQTATLKMLKEFGGGHIANLGHGVYPET